MKDNLQAKAERYANSPFSQLRDNGWDWSVTKPVWQLDRLIPAQSIGMVFGPSNSGKSHLVCDMVMATVRGDGKWQDREQHSGPVVMFSESLGHIKARMKAYQQLVGVEPRYPLHLHASMGTPLHQIDLMAEYLMGLDRPPVLLVFDTFSTSFDLGDAGENDNSQVARLVKAMESELLPCLDKRGSIMIVHHTSKASGGATARGASALVGNIDWSINVQWDKDMGRTVAKWDKDRWRLNDTNPIWGGEAERVEVEFTNGSYRMMALNWSEIDELAQEAAAQLERDQALSEGQLRLIHRCREMIQANGWAFVRTNRRARVPQVMEVGQVHISECIEKALQPDLVAWARDKLAEFDRETIYTKTGTDVGHKFTPKSAR